MYFFTLVNMLLSLPLQSNTIVQVYKEDLAEFAQEITEDTANLLSSKPTDAPQSSSPHLSKAPVSLRTSDDVWYASCCLLMNAVTQV